MIGRKAVVGLSLVSALLFCAFGAQSASAAISTAKNITAFECTSSAAVKDFAKAHCDPGDRVTPPGSFGHKEITGETPKVDATNEKVTPNKEGVGTVESEPAVLKGEVALTKTEITCTSVRNNLEKSSLINTESEKTHTLSGKATVEYTGCTVNLPLKCFVKEPIVANATVNAVEGLEGPKAEKNAMGLEFIGTGENAAKEKEIFAEITYEGAECSLKNKTFPVKGKVYGTGGPTTESSQENKESGSTLVFTPKFSMEELKLGPNKAEFTSIVTVRMDTTGPAIATTTTT